MFYIIEFVILFVFCSNFWVLSTSKTANAGSTSFLLWILTTLPTCIVKLLKEILKKKDWNWNTNQQWY